MYIGVHQHSLQHSIHLSPYSWKWNYLTLFQANVCEEYTFICNLVCLCRIKEQSPLSMLLNSCQFCFELWALSFELWALSFELWALSFELWAFSSIHVVFPYGKLKNATGIIVFRLRKSNCGIPRILNILCHSYRCDWLNELVTLFWLETINPPLPDFFVQ